MRKLKRLQVTGQCFITTLLDMDGKQVFICQGIPADSVVVGIHPGPGHDMVTIIIESESFGDLKEGELIPELDSPLITRIQGARA